MTSELKDRKFWLAKEPEISAAETTDMYFLNTEKVLKDNDVDKEVVMEVFSRSVPYDQKWGLLTGVYEAAKLLEGLPVDVYAFPEGEVFVADGSTVAYEPVMRITGKYRDFARYENPILGMITASTSVSTRAARFRIAAGGKLLLSFGTRRAHPVLAPMIERACYIAGFDGISNVLAAKMLGIEASGTMPHALMQIFGSQEEAWRLYDRSISKKSPRIALIDTFWDEKAEAIKALEVFGKGLWGVRVDTPGSRRGNFRKIIEEVRWELDIRGGKNVKIIASGSLEEDAVASLLPVVDGYGVGTAVAFPPVIDFSAKIVEVKEGGKWVFRSKRGGIAGRKEVYRSNGFSDVVTLRKKAPPGSRSLLESLMRNGKFVKEFGSVHDLRAAALRSIKDLHRASPSLKLE